MMSLLMEAICRKSELLVVLDLLLKVGAESVGDGATNQDAVELLEIQTMSVNNFLTTDEKRKSTGVKHYFIVIVSVLFLSLWSCKVSDEVPRNPMSVDIAARHEISIFDIFERVELIPLETTDESIFHRLVRLTYHDGVLYISDFTRERILAFDLSGKFLFKIDDRGQGPQQYLHFADFEISRYNNKILLLDPFLNSLIEYDLNGKFVRRIRLPEITNFYGSLRCLGDGIIAFWTFDDSNRLKFFDINRDSIFNEHFPTREQRTILQHFEPFAFPYANFVIREGAPSNNIYEIFPDGTYTIAYTWDFGRLNNCASIIRNLPPPVRSAAEGMALGERMRNSEFVNYYFWRIGGNQTYRYAQIIRRNQYINLFHNIAEKHTYVFTEFSEGATFFPLFWSDEFVIGLGPFAGYNEETIPDAILDERNLAIKRNICEFDNPVLIKYWFRR